MARKRSEKARGPDAGRCMECARAWLMHDGDPANPIIARCGTDGKRYAARVHRCSNKQFRRATGEPTIHPMEYLNR